MTTMISRLEAARRWLGRGGMLVAGATILLLAVYCAGESHGRARERTQMVDSLRQVLADSSRILEQRLAQRAPVIQQATARVDTVRVAYHEAAAHVAVQDDSTLVVDDVPVPTMPPVVALIRSSDSFVAAQDTLIHLQAAQIVDLTHDRDAWRARALLDEANTDHGSRLGFKSGVAIGVTVVLVIVHFVF